MAPSSTAWDHVDKKERVRVITAGAVNIRDFSGSRYERAIVEKGDFFPNVIGTATPWSSTKAENIISQDNDSWLSFSGNINHKFNIYKENVAAEIIKSINQDAINPGKK